MINLQTQLYGNNICHRTLKIIQKHLPNSNHPKESDLDSWQDKPMQRSSISEKNTVFLNFKIVTLTLYCLFANTKMPH